MAQTASPWFMRAFRKAHADVDAELAKTPSISCQRCGRPMGDDHADWAANGWLWRCPECAKASD